MLASSVAIGAESADTVTFSVAWPTARFKLMRITWLTCTTTPVRTIVAKPAAVAMIVYVPTRTNGKEYEPSSFVLPE